MDQHLNYAAHKAGVAEVYQAAQSSPRVLTEAQPVCVLSQDFNLLLTGAPGLVLGPQPQLLATLLLVLRTDHHQLPVVHVVLTGEAVHVPVLQVHPELVTGGPGVVLHAAAPAGEGDAGEAGVEPGGGAVAGVANTGGGFLLPRQPRHRADEPGVDGPVGLHPSDGLVPRQVGAATAGQIHYYHSLSPSIIVVQNIASAGYLRPQCREIHLSVVISIFTSSFLYFETKHV